MNDIWIESLIVAIISSLVTYFLINWWIKAAFNAGIVGKDMNKYEKIEVPEAGGLATVVGTCFGVMISIAYTVYIEKRTSEVPLLALVSLLLLSGFLGFIDDISGWKKGISPLKRVLLTLPISLPLMIIKSGYSVIDLPVIGVIDLGVLYPLLIVPIGILGASNAFNMIAGYNGLEAGQAIVISAFTILFCLKKGIYELVPILLSMLSSCVVFLFYNKYPAKVFPGNVFTYSFGAFYASIVILGNFEKFGLTMFMLYFIEFILFLRGVFDGIYKENFGKPNQDGSITSPYDKIYSLTHLAIVILEKIHGKADEKSVVILIIIMQIIIGLFSIFLYT